MSFAASFALVKPSALPGAWLTYTCLPICKLTQCAPATQYLQYNALIIGMHNISALILVSADVRHVLTHRHRADTNSRCVTGEGDREREREREEEEEVGGGGGEQPICVHRSQSAGVFPP